MTRLMRIVAVGTVALGWVACLREERLPQPQPRPESTTALARGAMAPDRDALYRNVLTAVARAYANEFAASPVVCVAIPLDPANPRSPYVAPERAVLSGPGLDANIHWYGHDHCPATCHYVFVDHVYRWWDTRDEFEVEGLVVVTKADGVKRQASFVYVATHHPDGWRGVRWQDKRP